MPKVHKFYKQISFIYLSFKHKTNRKLSIIFTLPSFFKIDKNKMMKKHVFSWIIYRKQIKVAIWNILLITLR